MFHKFIFAAALTLAASVVFADTPALDKREANQEQRIKQGVKSGELTKPEAKRLQKDEHRLERQEALAKSDGKVTAKERAHLQREAARDSKRIHRQKHDRQVRA